LAWLAARRFSEGAYTFSLGAARAFSRLASIAARRRGVTTKGRFPILDLGCGILDWLRAIFDFRLVILDWRKGIVAILAVVDFGFGSPDSGGGVRRVFKGRFLVLD